MSQNPAISSDESSPRQRHEGRRNARIKEVEVIQEILEELKYSIREQSEKLNGSLLETKEMRKQLEKLTKSHSDLCKKLDLNTNGIRSQSDQVQPPRYRLEFKDGDIANTVDKDKDIEITVTLVDVSGRTVENGPLAKATVELVVVSAEFNQYDNQHNWSREDFERHIVTKQNSSMRNVCQPVKSIVSNGQFNLVDGECHSKFKIFSNSSNKKVRLGVMVVSPMEERVLEGLSKPFFVRGHDRPNRQKQKGQLPNTQDSSSPNSTLAGVNISGGNTAMVPPQPHSRQEQPASIQQYVPDWLMSDPDICWEGLCNSELAGAFGTQFNNHGLPTMRLMSEYFGLTVTIPKEDQQTCGKRGIVTEPREPDGSVEEVPLKRNLAFDDKTNITPTSFCARMLASAQEERIQVDISETFLMKDYSLSGQPHGSWFHHTDEELRPKDAATCLAARRDTRLMASKPTITNPTLPRLKGPTQCLPPPPPPRFMATARDMHPVAAKPTVPGVTPFTLPTRFWMTSSIASNPTITSEKGIPLTAHPMALKPTGPSVVDATLPTQISTTISMAPEHVFGSKDGTRQDGSSPLSVLFGLESHKRWVHSRENTPFIYGMTTQSTQIGKTEFAGRLHMSHTCFTHHCPLLLSSILSPPSSDSHHHLRQVSTPDPNRATYSDSSVPLRLVFPPSWCLSGVFINGSRSAYHDCCRLSSTHVSFVINAAAHPQILPPDGGSSLPPMATTERRSLHECVRNAVAGPAVGVHDARKGWWSRVVDWHFFVGFSFA